MYTDARDVALAAVASESDERLLIPGHYVTFPELEAIIREASGTAPSTPAIYRRLFQAVKVSVTPPVSSARVANVAFRPLVETIRDTLRWRQEAVLSNMVA